MFARLPNLQPHRRAFYALAVGAIGVGASPIFLRLGELGPFAAAFHRVFLAIPLIALWLVVRGGARVARPKSRRDFALMMLAGFFFAGDLAFWHLALFDTTVANATLFANTAPVFVVLAGWLLFRRRVTPRFLSGMVLALLGSFFLVHSSLSLAPAQISGDAYGLATALFLAGYLMVVERLRERYEAAVIMLWSSLGTAMCLLPLALVIDGNIIAKSVNGWVFLLALAWVSQAIGQGLIAYALAVLPASATAVGLLLEPLAAGLLAALFLMEGLSLWQGIGGAIILAGIALLRSGRN